MNKYSVSRHVFGIRYSIVASFTAASDSEARAIRDRDYPGLYLCRNVGTHYGESV